MVDIINSPISSLPHAHGVVRKKFKDEFNQKEEKSDQKKRKKKHKKVPEAHEFKGTEYADTERENNDKSDSIDIFI